METIHTSEQENTRENNQGQNRQRDTKHLEQQRKQSKGAECTIAKESLTLTFIK